MSLYFTDFSEYTLNAKPSDWTERISTTNVAYDVVSNAKGKELFGYVISSGFKIITWDDIDSDSNRAKCEILTSLKQSNFQTSATNVSLLLRFSGTSGAENGYVAELYQGTAIRIAKYVNGTRTQLGTASITRSTNTWYNVRFRANLTALKVKIWEIGTSEPSSWTLEVTDSAISSAGWTGLRSETIQTDNLKFDFFSVGTNGDTAGKSPLVDTSAATNIVAGGGTLNANIVDDDAVTCNRYFEYGTTTAYGTTVETTTGNTGTYAYNVTGLTPNTTYHFRAKTTNATGTSYGEDATFTTLETYKASNLDPDNNEQINPLVSNTFTWDKDSQAVQTHYEIQYRIKPT